MKIYLVGGAVRDELLGLPITERDYVVVGSSPEEMLQQGFRPVGKDFPVFLHPDTGAEYALARTERKIGPGHQGFECHASSEVTLEEDLLRRDLTINAMAKDTDGVLIDPYGGQADLSGKVLRHVSPAFSEDPLRILRLARFKARFHGLGFNSHDTTTRLVTAMVAEDQLSQLPGERILAEMDKALATPAPGIFFSWLQKIGGAMTLWPEITDTGLAQIERHAQEVTDIESRFVLLLADQSSRQIENLCSRLKCTRARTEITSLIATHIYEWANLSALDPVEIVAFLYQIDALRRPERFASFNAMATSIGYPVLGHPGLDAAQKGSQKRSRQGSQKRTDLGDRWMALLKIARAVNASTISTDATGPALGEAIRQKQIDYIEQSRKV